MSNELLRDFRVEEFMSRNVATIDREAKVSDAIKVMVGRGIGCVVVTGQGATVGVLTERDLVDALADGGDIRHLPIHELMDAVVNRVPRSTGSKDSARMMTETRGRLLVFDSGRLVGIVTATDIVRVVWRLGVDFGIQGVVSQKVVSIESWMPILVVVKMMHENKVGSVILNHDGRPAGIVTERDLLGKVLHAGLDMNLPSIRVATEPLVSAEFGTKSAAAANAMVQLKIRRLPLTKEGKVIGIVTARDIVEAYAYSGSTSNGERQSNLSIRHGEICPICGRRIDPRGVCGCDIGAV